MLRILIANLVVQVLPLALIAAGLVLLSRKRAEGAAIWRGVGLLLLALPLGLFAYVAAGIAAAALRGDGHFYSVPFGGYSVSNGPLLLSLAVWISLVIGILTLSRLRSH